MLKTQFETTLKIGFLICAFVLAGATRAVAQGGPSALIISEVRFRGYFGSNDEYVELYNNSDSDIIVNAADGSGGWTVAEYGGYRLESSGNPVLPNGTVIKARSHVLVANYYQSTRSVVRLYDCCSFVAYGYFDGHQVGDDVGVAIFATNNQANFTDANKLDSVGFSTIGSGPYREGAGLPPIGSAPGEYAWIRRANGFQLQDTNDNLADFQFVSTTGGTWNGVQSILGGPAPENGFSARRGNQPGNATPAASLLDSNVAATIQPNELRDFQPVGNGTEGTLEIRRKITNTTGAAISQLRLRVTDITGYPAVAGMADLRVLSSIDKSVQLSNGTTVTVKGTRVDQPPTQFLGGGLNSSISVQLPGGSLANGASVNIRIVFGVMQVGNYRFATDIPLGDTEGTIVPGAANVSIFGKVGNTSDGPTIGFSGVMVTLSGSQSATTTTDANGNYAFNNLLAGGSYSISATKSGFTFTPIIQQIVNLSGNQEVDFNGGFNKPQPGDILISEFRNRGPNGANDEFIELYNNTDTDFTVSTDDESQGWTVVLNGGYNVIILPNGFVLKARQHFAGTEFYMFYSGIPGLVNNYLAPRDTDWGYFDGFGLPDDSGLGLFKTNDPAHFANAYRLDAVGFSTMSNSLFKEGSGLAPLGATESEYSFVRRQIGFTAQDTHNNAADFVLVSTDGGVYNGSQSVLGAPGPETTSAPVRGNLPGVCGLTQSLLDTDAPANGGENFVNAGSTISIRRKIANGSSTKMTRVRFRVTDISTLGNRAPTEADLRIVNSSDTTATLSNGSSVTVKGTTLEDPPSQPNGGGLNSSLGVMLPGGGLNPGASINVQFLLNVVQPGTYRFDIDTSDIPCDLTGPTTAATVTPAPNAAGWNKNDVTVALNATDNANGAGIKEINYIMSGGQSLPLTAVASTNVAIPIAVEGQTIITYFARDNASNVEAPHTLIVKLDKTTPVISNLPSPVVEATSPSGANVTWTSPTASDNLDPSPSLNCSALSGSSFPIGATQVTCTSSDQAGNSSTADFTVTVNPPADAVAPVTASLASPNPNANGWNNSDVTVALSAADNVGGLGVKDLTFSAVGAQTIPTTMVNGANASLLITAEGVTTLTYFARDNAGNSEIVKSLVIKIDKTAPVINASRTPNANAAGWNKEDVTAGYSATDALSGLDPGSPSTGSFVFSSEGANQSHTFTVTDAAGNTTSATVDHISIDKTAPMIDSQATSAGNPYTSNAWTNHPVTVSFNCSDSGSGVADITQPAVLNAEGASQSAAGVCTDVAGNTADATFNHINIDMTAPTLSLARTPAANAAGWNKENVTASYTASDALSGLSAGSQPTGSFTFGVEGANQSHTFTVTDAAGNSATGTIDHVNIDKSAPTVACGSADSTWHSSDVAIACTGSENISTLADSADSNFTLTTSVAPDTETAGATTNTRTVCDVAGNCATAGPISGNKVDKKPPVITITAPTAGNYLLSQAVTVHFSCTDGGSGVAACVGTAGNGAALDTASIGSKTFTVNATDNAGNNAAPATVNYSISYGVVVLFDQTKAAKSGSTIPIKIQLVDANGANVSSPATVVHAVSVVQVSSQSSPILQDAGNANPDYDFRYDSGLSGYIFNLKTTGFASGSYLLNFIAGGGSPVYSVGFQVRQ